MLFARLLCLVSASIAGSVFPAPLSAQMWELAHPIVSPAARDASAGVWDPLRQVFVVFGGDGRRSRADTWEWNGTSWTERLPSVSPSARAWHAMAMHRMRGESVVFGGVTPTGVSLDDTWVWDGQTWQQRAGPAPTGRCFHAMAFDEARQTVVLFGGVPSGVAALNDTWEWDGTSWTQRSPVVAPAPRWWHSMVYDARRQRVLLWGGKDASQSFQDLWAWDGAQWQQLTSASSPPAMVGAAMTYDRFRDRVVLVPSFTSPFAPIPLHAWEWDGVDWAPRPAVVQPGIKLDGVMVFDEARAESVLFGGRPGSRFSDETWRNRPSVAAVVEPFGLGCSGSQGVPALTNLAPWDRPWLGSAMNLRVQPAPGALCLGMVGDSEVAWNGVPLPFDLQGFGAPGCQALIAPFSWVVTPVSGGVADWVLNVPSDPALLGLQFPLQALVQDRGANQAGFVVSQGLRLTVGAR